MKKLVGAMTIIATILTMAPPSVIFAKSFDEDTGTYSSRKVSRDLGEKGQIVIESLELNEADIGDVVRLLARLSGINIITGDIRGSITVYLENVTVQDAMEAILASQGYGFLFDGNIVRVVEASRLGEDRVETITETFLLNYLPAEEVANTLKNVFKGGDSLGGSYSQIEANIEANAVIVVDIPRKMEDIRRLIYILDRRFEQVEIEGRFIELSYSQDQEWGIDWQYFQDPANTFDVNLAPQPLDAQNVAGQFKFAVINGNHNLNGFIQALETDNDIRILANPKILALENQPALIELTDELPFVEANISQGVITESVQFQETGIRLQVTPSIAHDSDGTFVRMTLDLEQRIPGPNVVLQNSTAFPVDSRHAQTDLIVPDESTVVIGGLRSSDLNYTYEKIPFLGSVPFLGAPFRRRAKTDSQTELILFVTPRVIYENPPLDMEEQDLHDQIDEDIDALETQAEWRKRVESPVDMLDKGIMYSGVECNDERYDRVEEMKKTIEGVKPYKVHKPKGIRKIRVDSSGQYVEEEEFVDESESDAPAEISQGEARDFSVIQEKARPGTGDSGAKFLGEGEEGDEGGATFQGPPPPLPPPSVPEAAPEAAPDSGGRERPSWLRRGTSSDAGEVLEGNETLNEISEEEVAEIEIIPEIFEARSEGKVVRDQPLEVPPLEIQEEEISLDDLDPWGLPSEYTIEIPSDEPVKSSMAPQPPVTVEETKTHPVPQPPREIAQMEVTPPVSETPQRMESDEPIEVEDGQSDLLAYPSESVTVGKVEKPKAEIMGAPLPGSSVPTVEIKKEVLKSDTEVPQSIATTSNKELEPIEVKSAPPAEVINLTGLVPAPVPRRIEKKEVAVATSAPESSPVVVQEVAVEEIVVQEPQMSVVDLRGKVVKQDPSPDLRSFLDPSVLDALKQMEKTESGTSPDIKERVTPAGSVDPWTPVSNQDPGVTLSQAPTLKVSPQANETRPDTAPLIAQNEIEEQPSAPAENQSKKRSWWKRITGRD